jgi:putative DNA primase/helicase
MIGLGTLKERFLSALGQDGIEPDCTIVADGRLHRFRHHKDKPNTRNGWYILFPDFPSSGAYGCWKRGIHKTWEFSPTEDSVIMLSRLVIVKKAMAQDYETGRILAQEILQTSIPANGQHKYLQRKSVGAYGIFYQRGALIIPLRDTAGRLHGVQRIYGDGSKRFSKGTDKSGHFHMIGSPEEKSICIAEGYATAATIHEVTNYTVVVAFDAGNLFPVAKALRTEYPDSNLIVCADTDRWTDTNPGMTHAFKAAEAVGGRLVWPRFSKFCSLGSDFNDLYLEEGKKEVRACFLGFGAAHV